MRMKIIVWIGVLLAFVIPPSFGQTPDAPWSFGMGVNFVDLAAPQFKVATQLRNANWEGPSSGLPIHIEMGRRINPSLNVNLSYSMVKIEDISKYGPATPLEKYNLNISDPYYWGLFGQLQYSFANGYLLKEDALLDPYISMGLGTSRISGLDHLSTIMSTGLDMRSGNIGFNAEIGYAYMSDREDYIRFKMGFKVFIGKKKTTPEIPEEPAEEPLTQEEIAEENQEEEDQKKNEGINITINIGTMGGQPYVQASYPSENGEVQTIESGQAQSQQTENPQQKPPSQTTKPLEEQSIEELFDEVEDKQTDNNNQQPENDSEISITPAPASFPFPKGKRIHFDIDKYEIKPRSFPYLNEVAKRLKENPTYLVRISGHTDDSYTREHNYELSENRAFAVQQYLIEQGVNPSQILPPKGYGEEHPEFPNDSDTNRSLNRRTELKLIKI
jgi:outer membrane protein OmpA-like peptidoglycan-associated protein